VAFANAYGGHLIVGIKETKEKPSRAEKLGDVNTNVAELAERLRSALNSIIDPPINGLQIQPIMFNETGGGFIVIHVPQSIHAPHGYGQPPEAYVRRADRSEPMTMRDMQNVFWEARTRIARIDAELESQRMRIVGQTPTMGRIRVGFIAVSKTSCTVSDIASIVGSQNPRRWPGVYMVSTGAVAIRSPDEIGENWLANHAGLIGSYSENRRSGSWEVDETGVISAVYDMEGMKSHATNSNGRNYYENHAIWHVNSLKVFLDFVKLVSSNCIPVCNIWIVKLLILTSPYDEILLKINDWDAPIVMKSSLAIEVRPVEIDFNDPSSNVQLLERKFWSAFGIPEMSRESVIEGRF
jgi:Putative DNA-binding domain